MFDSPALPAVLLAAGVLVYRVRRTHRATSEHTTTAALQPTTLAEMEAVGLAALPAFVARYYGYRRSGGGGGGGGGGGLHAADPNRAAFASVRLRTRVLALAGCRGEPDCSATLLGQRLAAPVLIAPTAFHALAHDDGEVATARAARACGAGYVFPFMLSTRAPEAVAAAGVAAAAAAAGVAGATVCGTQWAHCYILRDREYVLHTVREAERLGFGALVVTLDHAHEGVKRNTMPAFAAADAGGTRVRGRALRDVMVFPHAEGYRRARGLPLDDDSIGDNDPTLGWADVRWLAGATQLPIVCKGILTAEDAVLAAEHGAAAVIVSNHGGRQADSSPPALEALPAVARALRGRGVEVYLDSGVRRGSDVLKALAFGASAVLVGRPVLWGLAHDGQRGVEAVLRILRDELLEEMANAGCGTLAEATAAVLSAGSRRQLDALERDA